MRESNFDALRILAMLFIVIHHLTLGGLGLYGVQNGVLPGQEKHFLFLGCINLVCIVGVNLFFLMSGYFGINLTLRKVVKLIIELYFYAFVIHILGLAAGALQFNKGTLVSFIGSLAVYWFMLVYVILMLLSPFLNRACDNVSRNEYIAIIGGVFAIACVYGWVKNASSLGLNNGYSLISAVCLYVLGRGINKYHFFKEFSGKGYIISLLLSICLYAVIVYGTHSGKWAWHAFAYNQPFTFLASMFLIEYFSQVSLSIRVEKIVTWMAGSVLAVYYIHSSNWMGGLRNLPVTWMENSNFVLLGLVLYACVIFVGCILVDKFRLVLLGSVFDKIIYGVTAQIEKVVDRQIRPRIERVFGNR